MTAVECFLCLKIKKELSKCIKIGSPTWNEQHVESVIEKHLWPMTFLKSKSRWLCFICWEMLHDFHEFYKRVKNSNECYEYIIKSENEDDLDECALGEYLMDDVPVSKLKQNNHKDKENKDESIRPSNKDNIIIHETILLEEKFNKNNEILQIANENADESDQLTNPLEISKTSNDSLSNSSPKYKYFVGKDFKYKCDICEDQFIKFSLLQKHFSEIHKQEAYVMCCGTKYYTHNAFGEHIRSHMNSDMFQCKYCLKRLKNNQSLTIHIAQMHESSQNFMDESTFLEHNQEHEKILRDEDTLNDNSFTSESNSNDMNPLSEITSMSPISNHYGMDINGDNRSESIEESPDPFLNAIEKSFKSHSSTQDFLRLNSKFNCDLCKEPCDSFKELQVHFSQYHSDYKVYVVCCGEKFKSRNSLSAHIRSHVIEGYYQCQYCKKNLKNKRNLKYHLTRLHQDKIYSCSICDNKIFTSNSDYMRHKALQHSNECVDGSKLENNCDIMEVESENIELEQEQSVVTTDNNIKDKKEDNDLYFDVTVSDEDTELEVTKIKSKKLYDDTSLAHIETTHEDIMEFDRFLKENHKFTCHLCNKPEVVFDHFSVLRQHFSTEHKIEGYVYCCNTKFRRRRILVDHIKGHMDPDYLKCKYCSKVFIHRRSLLQHMALHEGRVRRCEICKKKFFDPIKYENHKLTHETFDQIGNSNNDNANNNDDEYDDDDDIPLIQCIENEKLKKKQNENNFEINKIETNNISRTKSLPDLRRLDRDEFLKNHFKMVCHMCEDQSQTFENFALLRDHFSKEHNEEAYLVCCDQKFKRRDSLVHHLKKHLKPREFICEFCSKVLKTKRNLQYHVAACHGGKTYRCEICNNSFLEESCLKRHYKKHKASGETNFPCPECGKIYSHRNKLNHHISYMHLNRYSRLCDICGTYFRDLNLFRAHMKSRHVEDSKREKFPCKICGRIMTARSSLKLHMRTKHVDNEAYPYTCHICSKPVATQGLLNAHIRMTHKNIRPHKCKVCGKAFKELKQLRGHMGTHTGESIFKCSFCPKRFNSTGNLSSHRRKVHRKEWEEIKQKMFIQNHTPAQSQPPENV